MNIKFKKNLVYDLFQKQEQKVEVKIKKSKILKINFEAKYYIGMISLPENDVTGSPLLKHVSTDTLSKNL